MLLSDEKEKSAERGNRVDYAKGNKLNTKRYELYDFMQKTFWEWQNNREKVVWWLPGAGGRRTRLTLKLTKGLSEVTKVSCLLKCWETHYV